MKQFLEPICSKMLLRVKYLFDQRTLQGAYFALTAYCFWGVVPIYFKWVDHISPMEILCQRIVWALLMLLGILLYTGELHRLKTPVRQLPKIMLSASVLAVNWLAFIYAIVNGNITETALGYFINPLVTILLGVLFLKESMRPLQWLAVGIAASGILVQLIWFGKVPWLALLIAVSFGFYGLFRKKLNLHAVAGLTVESAIILPFALAYILWLQTTGDMYFGQDLSTSGLLILGGFVTAFPLLFFATAVTRLPLTAMGFYQYIAPSISLIIAVFYYQEPFDIARAISFGSIWTALILSSIESFHYQRKMKRFQLS